MTPLEKFWPETFRYTKKNSPFYRELFQARAKISLQIRRVLSAEIESLQVPPQSRKRRTFVDLR